MAEKPNTDGIIIVGAESHPLRDIYHSLLKMRWWKVVAAIAACFMLVNVIFACGYLLTGGVSGAKDGSFRDAFFFSVQTLGTIGYGAMYPQSLQANLIVTGETVAGVILTAVSTGLVFARFSQPSGAIVFSHKVCISLHDGLPTLNFRIGNDRSSTIFEAQIRVVMFRTEHTKEGVLFYRTYDLALVRDRAPALSRSWNVMHVIDEKSPFFGTTPASCVENEIELAVSIVGTDDTSLQPVHGRKRYLPPDLEWGARPADVLSERLDGVLVLDLRRFHEVLPTEPTEAFPYPERAESAAAVTASRT